MEVQQVERTSTMTERVALDAPNPIPEANVVKQLRLQFGCGKLNYKFTLQCGTNMREQDKTGYTP